jgi:hypothetical protein
LTPLGAIVRGALAGAIGTIAMDLLWYSRYRRSGGDTGFIEWEFSAEPDSWDTAPAPARFGRRLIVGILQRDVPLERAGLVNNVMHWATGVGWGSAFGLVEGSVGTRRLWHGLAFGAGVWLQSYVVLVPAKLYKPPWEYDAKTLGKDLSAHGVYGLTTATTFRVLAKRAAAQNSASRPHVSRSAV